MATSTAILALGGLSAGAQLGGGVGGFISSRREADQLREIGRLEAAEIRRRGRRTMGAQQAAYAAAGLRLGEGTPLEVLGDTAQTVELEALREKFAFRSAAREVKREGAVALTRSILGAASTGLGAAQAAGLFEPSAGGTVAAGLRSGDFIRDPVTGDLIDVTGNI